MDVEVKVQLTNRFVGRLINNPSVWLDWSNQQADRFASKFPVTLAAHSAMLELLLNLRSMA